MISRAFKLRIRRGVRIRQRQVSELGLQAEAQLDQHLFKRFERLVAVRRFVASWLLLFVLLGGILVAQIRALGNYYQTIRPTPGGVYTEGIVGSFTTANPLFATAPVDAAVAHLIFAGLFTYNDQNQLVGDLAQDHYDVDASGRVYTVHLRPGLSWQDGTRLTSADVAFTYQSIENPAVDSPLRSSWQGIVVAAPNPTTVTFTLPNPLSSFMYSLTNGIVPQHLLQNIAPANLRTAQFNTADPVGAGPFRWQAIQGTNSSGDTAAVQIALSPFAEYHAGAPKLSEFVVRSFGDQDSMIASFKREELTAMAGLSSMPPQVAHQANVRSYSMQFSAAVMSFFQTNQGVLADKQVRQALVRATDTLSILRSLGYPASPVRGPLLREQLGYNASYAQAGFDLASANTLLDAAGWARGNNGIRAKAGVPLSFKLYAQDSGDYPRVARELQQQWRAAGADVQLVLQNDTDFQAALAYHTYEALLYGISIGVDPDVFAYWDSSQADSRSTSQLNFSNYQSAIADASLEAGRTRLDPSLRAIKYQPFQQAWQADAPAVGLYQPRFLYVTRGQVYGLTEHTINADVQRFDNVQNWMIREVRVSQGH